MLTFVLVAMQILRKLKHENIIAMLDSFESPQEFCVVTEFAQVIITPFSGYLQFLSCCIALGMVDLRC